VRLVTGHDTGQVRLGHGHYDMPTGQRDSRVR
jgi:hypothetical protein